MLHNKESLLYALVFQAEQGTTQTFEFIAGRIHPFARFAQYDGARAQDACQASKQESVSCPAFQTIDEIKKHLENTQELDIAKMAKNIVIGDGNPNAQIMIIGEAPGEQEDDSGIPFCGKSGKLLELGLQQINLIRERDFFVTNTVFWRPPDNRQPTKDEINYCAPFLYSIINIVNPKIIITAGAIASKFFLHRDTISQYIGNFHKATFGDQAQTAQIFPVYHPSYLLRSPSSKKIFWSNLIFFSQNYKNFL